MSRQAAVKDAAVKDAGTAVVSERDMANAIRALAMDAVQKANSGHPGMPMGMADAATVLFDRFIKLDPSKPDWPDRDRFVLSAGHGSMLQYALHYLIGYDDMPIEQLMRFRQLGSRTAGHPEYGHAKGIETTTGPLGQGISTAVGMALAERMMATRFGADLVDHYTYVIAGDGCLQEGISHEAIDLAGHLRLNRLIVLWDDNAISIDGPTTLSSFGTTTQSRSTARRRCLERHPRRRPRHGGSSGRDRKGPPLRQAVADRLQDRDRQGSSQSRRLGKDAWRPFGRSGNRRHA